MTGKSRLVYHDLLFIAVLIPLSRIMLSLVSRTLFSVDIWPLYHSAEVLSRHDRIPVYVADKLYDGYTNHWPGEIIYVLIYSSVSGIGLDYGFTIVLLFTNALIAASMYRLLYVISNNRSVSTLLTIYYSMTPSILIYSSSLLKEVYTLPLLLILLCISVSGSLSRSDVFSGIVLFSAMVISHIATPYIFLGVFLSLIYVSIIDGRRYSSISYGFSGEMKRTYLYGLVLTIIYTVYVLLNSYSITYRPDMDDLSVYVMYLAFIYLSYMFRKSWRILGAGSRRIHVPLLLISAIILIYLSFFAGGMYLQGILVDQYVVRIYALPVYAGMVLLLYYASRYGVDAVGKSIGLFLSLNTLYILTGSPLMLPILHRILNYIPLFTIVGLASIMYRTCRGRLLVYSILLLTAVNTGFSILAVQGIVDHRDPLLYYWYYELEETRGYDTLLKLLPGNAVIVGDDKIYYYYMGLAEVKPHMYVDALYGHGGSIDHILVLYRDNYRYGLMIGLNRFLLDRLYEKYTVSKILDNGYIDVVVARNG